MSSMVINEITLNNLDNLFTLYSDVDTFYFEKGTYYLTKQLDITKDNIRFIGLTGDAKDVHIIQQTDDKNGLNIIADNFVLNYVSVHVNNGSGVCLAHAQANWTNIENCHFYGSNSNFAVYFAGPVFQQGQDTLDGYSNGDLDMHNVFDNNIVYTKWSGDAISFSLQRYGSVRDNIVRGGKIALYMLKDCLVTHNKIYDSISHGIICSLPSQNIDIIGNKINNSGAASINVRVQAEHVGEITEEQNNIKIMKNDIINSNYFGIEVNSANDLIISNNKIKGVKEFGIYLLKSSNITVEHNTITKFRKGVHIDLESTNNTIINNSMYSVFPNTSEHAIDMLDQANNNVVTNNILSGMYLSNPIKDAGMDNVIENNNIEQYHSYRDELLNID